METTIRWAGADGCRAGWVAVGLGPDGAPGEVRLASRLEAVLEAWPELELVCVDIPIGLPPCGTEARTCDRLARKELARLGPRRGSSVFPAPSRAALAEASHQAASEANRRCLGRGLSLQSWHIGPKVAEVDALLRARPALRECVVETHPELAFMALAGGAGPGAPKKSGEGRAQRRAILRGAFPGSDALLDDALARYRRSEVARDDLLDALVCALTARHPRARLRTLPDPPARDDEGLPMQIVVPRTPETDPAPTSDPAP